jgi:flagellin FlaB
MRKICDILKRKDVGSIGIGAMIVFIAMVLVAGIAASVLIQTSTTLETQAMATGQETTKEVSTGIAVFDILGYAADGADISKVAIMVRPRAGSDGIDLAETYLELANSTIKVILNYTTTYYAEPDGQDDIFAESVGVWPISPFAATASQFGILVVEDADGSFTGSNGVVMNQGDKAFLCVNTTGCFNNIEERSDIWGMVVPEEGSPGIISFTTPASYSGNNVFDLQ